MSVFLTSDKPRFAIAPCSALVRQHAIVLFADAPLATRQHALQQIERLANEGDDTAVGVLQQFADLKIDLTERIQVPSETALAAKIDRTCEYEAKTYKCGERQKRQA